MASSLPVLGEAARASPPQPAPRHRVVGARCNLGCEPCHKLGFAREQPPAELDEEGVVVTGGDPLLEPGLLARLKSLRHAAWVETNGALLHTAANARRLAAAGVRGVRLYLPGWDRASSERIARVPQLGALQEQAARNVLAAGLELAFVAPVSEQNERQLPRYLERAERLAETGPREPLQVFLSWALAPEARPSQALELALAQLALAAIRRGLLVRFDGPLAPAPCVFRRPEAFASLLAGPLEERPEPAECASCPLQRCCPGPAPGAAPKPLVDDGRGEVAFRAALATLEDAGSVQAWVRSPAERWGRENFVSIGSEPDLQGGEVHSALLRPFFNCNQDCSFCWVDLKQKRSPTAAIQQTFAALALEGMTALSITGGEPSLDKRLPELLRLARALGITQITLQTNAVRLDDLELARELAEAGLTRAFVSLHGATAEVSEAITRAPQTFERTLAGIRNLLECGVSVGVGIVFTHENAEQPVELVELVGRTLPGVDITFSVAAPVNDRVDAAQVTPRYSSLAPTLRRATRTAHELGLEYVGLHGQCGVPPCILDADPICLPELYRSDSEWSAAQDFIHPPVCEGCSLRNKCPGLRTAYAATHGVDELHAVPQTEDR